MFYISSVTNLGKQRLQERPLPKGDAGTVKIRKSLWLDSWRRIFYTYVRILIRRATKLNVAVTNKCDMRCKTCGIWKICQSQPELVEEESKVGDYEEFFKAHNDWNWISFTGGEPFLRKDLVDIVFAAYERCKGLHTISIPTNGYLTEKVEDDVQEILLETRLPSFYVSVSLDGLQDLHDSIRGVDGAFEHAITTFTNLRKIESKRLKVHFEYVISKFNQGKLPELINSLNLTPDDFIITIAQNAFFYCNESWEVKPDKDALNSDLRWFLSHYKIRSTHDMGQWLFLNSIIKRGNIPCVAGRNSFYMDPCGKIFPCIFISRQIGSIGDDVISPFKPNPRCRCYTPCESYFSLLLHLPEALSNLI